MLCFILLSVWLRWLWTLSGVSGKRRKAFLFASSTRPPNQDHTSFLDMLNCLGALKFPHKMLSHSREDKELRWDFRHDLCVGDTLGSKSVFLFLQMSPSIGYAQSTHHWNHYERHGLNLIVLEMNVKKSCYQKTQLVSRRRSGYNKTLQ